MPNQSDVSYSVKGAAAVISFDRPERMNAARMKTHEDLIAAMDRAEADEKARCIVLTGEGRAFCAGTDIGGGFELPVGGNPATGEDVPPDVGGGTVLRLFNLNKPVIAAVNGAAIGFGASLTVACDFRIASEHAKWGFVFSRRGIASESCVSWFLPRAVGINTALDWMLTGRMVPATEALETRFVSSIEQNDKLMDAALAIADDLAANTAPISVAMNRRLLWRMLGAAGPEIAHDLESRALSARLQHRDSKEGVDAFVQKRQPEFESNLDSLEVMKDWWA